MDTDHRDNTRGIDWASIEQYSVMPRERLARLHEVALQTSELPGAAVELGIYRGGSTLLIAQALPHKAVHAFDSFEGLQDLHKFDRRRATQDQRGHAQGDFRIGSERERSEIRTRLNKHNIILHEGLFSERRSELDRETFCFGHFDADTYSSALQFLEFVFPRLVAGGRMVLDDFRWTATPGVERALHDYFGSEHAYVPLGSHQALVVKG